MNLRILLISIPFHSSLILVPIKSFNFSFIQINVILEILRNLNANTKVVESIVQVLSIPFVMKLNPRTITQLQSVYIETKVLPNLIVASKIMCTVKPPSLSSMSSTNLGALHTEQANGTTFRGMHELSSEQMKTLRTIYELVCHLMHSESSLERPFLVQFRESVIVIADDLLRHFFANGKWSQYI